MSTGILNIRQKVLAVGFDFLIHWYTIAILYKVVFQKFIMEVRYPEFLWSEFYMMLFVSLVTSFTFFLMPRFSIGKVICGLDKLGENESHSSQKYTMFGYFVLVLTFLSGIHFSQISLTEFLSQSGLIGAHRIFSALLSPNMSILGDALSSGVETIYMAFMATSLALPVAFVISFAASRNLMQDNRFTMAIYSVARFLLNVSRSIEPLVWAIIFSVWVGIGPFSGMLALCVHSIASLSKLYSEQIENIDDGPVEAIKTTGANPIQVIWFGVVPQIVLPFLSFTIYRWDINVRMATVIGLVGGGGIGTLLMQYQGLAKWNEVGLLVIVIAAIVWVMDYASSKIREAIK